MAKGRRAAEWESTSSVLAMLANVNRDPKNRPQPYQPHEFDPTHESKPAEKKPAPSAPISALKIFLSPAEAAKCRTLKPALPTSS